MEDNRFSRNIAELETPCYLIDQGLLIKNLEILKDVQDRANCKILLALKSFSMWSAFPLIKKYLYGVCASSPNEARLGFEEFGKEVHTFAPAYSQEDIKELVGYSNYIIFNSISQWEKHKDFVLSNNIQCGLRINPEYSEVKTALYDPCAKYSRLGITLKNLEGKDLEGISGLHFHAMCEQNSDTLKRILEVVEKSFGKYIAKMKWINFGGGHHITREDYDIDLLCETIKDFKKKYNIDVYLEPGEAIALNAGVLVSTVLDVVDNDMPIAILDTSAEAHMPDVLAMPYRPQVLGAGNPGEKKHTVRLGGLTCLAGDIIGDYSFEENLKPGDKIVFLDMAIYTMVKNTTFNGVRLPSIAIQDDKGVKTVKIFGYDDYKSRL